MARYFDRKVAEQTRTVAGRLRNNLQELGFQTTGPKPSGDVAGGWVVTGRLLDGFEVSVVVAGGPWENDGTWKGER